ncbi:hypothetical protein CcaverHIS002_0411680 [Cutaneotrichosporon cavernicola]|nr:hypothetical protein CcaverHIS002_0411680 [Cutaneotrichosporon cavernicola]BEJ00111.1 hypothetical protein CcaverHIS631_0411530 [Cutaneotrichosporon cavernicola]BEJ07882.1 hypothetical protein CcaverHIS641_0411510 [Cutaneotrichosporon cavernicola]
MPVVIDVAFFPHILDEIIASADTSALISLRATSSTLRTRCDAKLARHLVWMDGDLVIAPSRHSRTLAAEALSSLKKECVKIPVLRHGTVPIFEKSAFLVQKTNIPYRFNMGHENYLNYLESLTPGGVKDIREDHVRRSPFNHSLTFTECEDYYAAFQSLIEKTQVLDIRHSILVRRQSTTLPGILYVDKRLPVLRIWTVPRLSPERSYIRRNGKLEMSADTIVLCCSTPLLQPLGSPLLPISPCRSTLAHRPPLCYEPAALPTLDFAPPKRLIIHIGNTIESGIHFHHFSSLCSEPNLPATEEIVYVAHSFKTFIPSDLLCLFPFWYDGDMDGGHLKITVVNPTSSIPTTVLERLRIPFGWMIDPLPVGELIKRFINRMGVPGIIEKHYRFISFEEWEEELGPERFAIEMGEPL